jgi:hypothetical protein
MNDMATPPSDDSRTLFKLLSDGEWHGYTEVRDALARTVPPGRAIRKYEERLAYSREFLTGANGPQKNPTEDEKIELGQRACAQRIITSWKGRGVQARGEGSEKQVRMKPGFRTWGVDTPAGNESGPGDPGPTEVTPEPVEAADGELSQPQVPSVESEPVQAAAETAAEDFIAPREPYEPPVPTPVTPAESDPYAWPSPKVSAEDLPECPECGLGVINQSRHDEWHASMKQLAERSEMALLDENAMRTLLGDVMGLVLDKFQDGMVGYLEERFADFDGKLLQVAEALLTQKRPSQRWVSRSAGSNPQW